MSVGSLRGRVEPRLRSSVLAAAPGGCAILLAFFVWHWYNIAPVWNVLVEGAVGVALASLAVGWAWMLSRRAGRFAGAWGGAVFGGVFAAGVLLGELLGLAAGPRPDPGSVAEAIPILRWVLIPVALVTVAGWRIARGWRGALAYGIASLPLLVYLGGSVVQRGGTGLGLGLFSILFPGYLVAGALLGWLEPRLPRAPAAPEA